MSKSDEFCIANEELCIKNEDIQNDECCREQARRAAAAKQVCRQRTMFLKNYLKYFSD